MYPFPHQCAKLFNPNSVPVAQPKLALRSVLTPSRVSLKPRTLRVMLSFFPISEGGLLSPSVLSPRVCGAGFLKAPSFLFGGRRRSRRLFLLLCYGPRTLSCSLTYTCSILKRQASPPRTFDSVRPSDGRPPLLRFAIFPDLVS